MALGLFLWDSFGHVSLGLLPRVGRTLAIAEPMRAIFKRDPLWQATVVATPVPGTWLSIFLAIKP